MVYFFLCYPTFSQNRVDTVKYEYVDMYSNGYTKYAKVFFINDTVMVVTNFFGKKFEPESIEEVGIDTFIVGNNKWKKMYEGKTYNFFSIDSFEAKKQTTEYSKSNSPSRLINVYTPVEKLRLGSDNVYVYDLTAMRGGVKFYDDTRIYFSYHYGIVGYINYDNKMLMNQFVGKVKMRIRKLL